MLVNWFDSKEKQSSHIFMTGGSFVAGSKVPTKVRLLSSHTNWEIEVSSLWMFLVSRDGSQVLKRTFLDHIAGRRLI